MPEDARQLLHEASPQPDPPDDFEVVWTRARRQRRVRRLTASLGAAVMVGAAAVVLSGLLAEPDPGGIEVVGEPDEPGQPEVRPDALVSTWLRPTGEPADRGPREFEVRSIQGDPHCDWEGVVFLTIAWPVGTTYEAGPGAPPTRQYVRDAHDDLGPAAQYLMGELQLDADLPAEAQDTGYHTEGGAELWLGPDDGEQHVYVVLGDDVERWPRAQPPIACA